MNPTPGLHSNGRRDALIRERLPLHLERLQWSADQIAEHQRVALRELVRVALTASRFHAERLAGVDPDRFELEDLRHCPVMTKSEMMDAFDDVVTDRRLRRADVEAHLARTSWDAEELPGGYVAMASGGSSGRRGVFVYSTAAAADFALSTIRTGLARMLALLGGLPAEPVPVALIAAPSAVHATRLLPSLFGGDILDITSIAATDPLASIVDRLNGLQPLLLQGYPSAIRKLAEERLSGRLRVSPLGVATTSEALAPTDRARIEEAFGVGVVDTFGSSEGLCGTSPPDDQGIVLASDLAIAELVDDDGEPVPPGVPSAKVYVTNLFNTTQPLIRYELTDSFTRLDDADAHGHLRVRVDGRSDDAFAYGAVIVEPIAVRTIMVKTPDVHEYQVRQTARGIDVDVVAPDGLDEAALARRLAASLESTGLADAQVRVRVVEPGAIERNPGTGKTRRFVPLPLQG